jgi:hypothetical protein
MSRELFIIVELGNCSVTDVLVLMMFLFLGGELILLYPVRLWLSSNEAIPKLHSHSRYNVAMRMRSHLRRSHCSSNGTPKPC